MVILLVYTMIRFSLITCNQMILLAKATSEGKHGRQRKQRHRYRHVGAVHPCTFYFEGTTANKTRLRRNIVIKQKKTRYGDIISSSAEAFGCSSTETSWKLTGRKRRLCSTLTRPLTSAEMNYTILVSKRYASPLQFTSVCKYQLTVIVA